MSELRECPFCRGEAEILHYEDDGYLPKCSLCSGMVENWFATEDEAITAWNTRPEPEPRALTLEEMNNLNGTPIYFQHLSGGWKLNGWHLPVASSYSNNEYHDLELEDNQCVDLINYGITWLAYDREPKGV